MVWILLGALIGIIMGLVIDIPIPIQYIKYTAVMIIVILDSLFGAAKAEVSKEDYSPSVFTSGLVFNIALALGITLLGERLGLDLYLAVTVVFTLRIFANLGVLRRALLKKIKK